MPGRLGGTGCAAVLPVRTDRLVLRPPTPEDVADVVALAGDWAVARHTGDIPHPLTDAPIRAWIGTTRQTHADGTGVSVLITEAETGAIAGAVTIAWHRHWPEAELGYWVGRPFWGRGYATEAVRAITDLGFATFDLAGVFSSTRGDNTASQRVLDKVGLRPDGGVLEVPAPARGDTWMQARRALTRDDWVRLRAARARMVLVVAAALVDPDGRVLLAQRPEGKTMAGLWEFPGGKVATGETPEAALIRELREELGVDARAACLAPLTFASHAYADFHLLMPLYILRNWAGTPTAREGQALAWVRPARLRDYPMPAADRPLIPVLQDLLGG
ncbi:8-oxo-dGTP diphosphatase [Roseospira visakhapatnamensis]|uniref:8-oxo-dGTP diphosphatase n=2 Tax=Roseospira visakhapatnamensis TaxID=390880 RepID=A0A7W6RGY5_9PROT|nr:bifunctional GNAT family N-acetyltransferase/(deoxy)nucleoside triphosphate pyrophosphohydrolase [Roseospira visakhapatnamensis]MBB4268140.1 8-oxo-dGTP diphosphatase [Roseospira visakhapatnamensis]